METQTASATDAGRKLRRRLWWERGLFFALLGLGIAYYYGVIRGLGGACLVAVDGKPAVVVRNRAVAKRVLDGLRRQAGDLKGVHYSQKVTLHQVDAEGNRVVSDVEALRVLSSQLTLVVSGAGVFANDRLVFGLADRREAMRAISLLLKKLSPSDPDLTRAFRERVRVREASIPIGLFVPAAAEVLNKVQEMTASRGTHVVQSGETAWGIAGKYHVSLEALAFANPGLELNLLHEEDKLTIPGRDPPLTVIAWKEMEERIATGPLAGQTQTVRTVYENGRRVERAVIRRPHRNDQPRRRRPRQATPASSSRSAKPRRSAALEILPQEGALSLANTTTP